MRQQECIEEGILKMGSSNDGDTLYPYIGHVYPEVKAHFEEEGFCVETITSDMVLVATKGRPINVFIVKDDITLSLEEKEESEKCAKRVEESNSTMEGIPAGLGEIIRAIAGEI